jgi:hypothetical protein
VRSVGAPEEAGRKRTGYLIPRRYATSLRFPAALVYLPRHPALAFVVTRLIHAPLRTSQHVSVLAFAARGSPMDFVLRARDASAATLCCAASPRTAGMSLCRRSSQRDSPCSGSETITFRRCLQCTSGDVGTMKINQQIVSAISVARSSIALQWVLTGGGVGRYWERWRNLAGCRSNTLPSIRVGRYRDQCPR